ncbi:MAG: DUF4129 domain-containing protein [Promethearchaeota archaeon]
MNTKDFNSLFQKEFLVFCLLLIALAFAQASLGQISGFLNIKPIFKLRYPIFETLGVILPIVSGIYIYLNYRTKHKYPWALLTFIIIVLLITFIFTAYLGALERPEGEEEPIFPIINPNSTSTSIPPTESPISKQETTDSSSSVPGLVNTNTLDFSSFLQIIQEFGSFFFISLLLFPLLFMMILRLRSSFKDSESTENEDFGKKHAETHYKLRTVIECYYQASACLEERGADSSSSFTPTEFSKDVVTKSLTSPPLIENLTNVFEEVKFSRHDISDQKVSLAKSLAAKIIFPDLAQKNNTEEEAED